jgi:hypothetical protein
MEEQIMTLSLKNIYKTIELGNDTDAAYVGAVNEIGGDYGFCYGGWRPD